jgi:1,3-beta-glucan synthase
MLVVFIALIAAPLVVRRLNVKLPTIPYSLMQPNNLSNNDTTTGYTGNGLPPGFQTESASGSGAAAATTSSGSGAKMMFMF